MQLAFKTYLLQCNIWFKYVSSIFYQKNKNKKFGEVFEYIMIFIL
jgi:hypothetical protein